MVKQSMILLLLVGLSAMPMETPTCDPKLIPQITSFLNSYMAGECTAYETEVVFYDYREEKLRYQFSYEKANKLIAYCYAYQDNPLESLVESQTEHPDFHAKKEAACHALSTLSLKQVQLIQIFLFKAHLKAIEAEPLSPDHAALKALQFGDSKRFNAMMEIKARNPDQNILITIAALIEKIKKMSAP